jgi:hypothetical protein
MRERYERSDLEVDIEHGHVDHDDDSGDSGEARTPQTDLLRIIADDYSQAQNVRVGKGEQIRAIVQGRDQQDPGYLAGLGFAPVMRGEREVTTAADLLLKAILKGTTDEPHHYLAGAYRAAWSSERAAFSVMEEALADHPAWPWMSQVRGVGPTLGAKLLSRLDLDRADNPSSFWCYCGLATVPGQQWSCSACGYVGIFPATHTITGKHKGCRQLAALSAGPDSGVRAAQPRAEKGQKRGYDAFAKKTMYLLASSWLKAGQASFYNDLYRRKVSFYERERVGWEKGRRHYSALRAAEKVFLSHLYEAWCLAVGRVPKLSYAEGVRGHEVVRASEVLEWEQRMKAKGRAA